ncbi:MAG: hypothetical protein JSW54_07235 [Fidelibacterota bacterium]|nr:MAG: hypothetical protein JSW54_07235 [Candidatus Neomarinimicrobiota bacterium]
MSEPGSSPSEGITLCMVLHSRNGNLANALHSVNPIVDQIVIVDAGGGGGQVVKHLASEYDAQYSQVPADPDESALLNVALEKVQSSWALFLHQQEVIHVDDPRTALEYLGNTGAIALDLPIVAFDEPGNHFFETRLVRTDKEIHWDHTIFPSLTGSLERIACDSEQEESTAVMPKTAIVSLGEPEPEEWELRDTVIRLEKELDHDPNAIRYWHYLAETARALEEWDRAHSAVEEGLQVVSKYPDAPQHEPCAVNGLLGMFSEALLAGQHYPETTVESLLTIYNNMAGNGHFSVPLGHLLLAVNRENDAISVQRQAVGTFFQDRRYHLPMEIGLFKPVVLTWEIEAGRTHEALLRSVIEIQTVLSKHKHDMATLLQYAHRHNPALFSTIQDILQQSLHKLD